MSDKENTNDNTLEEAALGALLSAGPDAINTKVKVLKEALDNNTYTVNSEQIASKLLENAAHSTKPSTVSSKETKASKEAETA